MLLLTHCRLMSKSGCCRSFAWTDARSPRDSIRSSGMGTSRPRLLLLPVTSGRREMIGGSWLSRRSAGRRERHSPTRSPVRSMTRMAIADLVAGRRGHKGPGLLGGEVVGQLLCFPRHASPSLRGFTQPSLPAEGSWGKVASVTGRPWCPFSCGNPGFPKLDRPDRRPQPDLHACAACPWAPWLVDLVAKIP